MSNKNCVRCKIDKRLTELDLCLNTIVHRQNAELIFFLFSFDPAGKMRDLRDQRNKKHKPYSNIILFSINCFFV